LNANTSQKRKIYEIVLKHIRDWNVYDSTYVYDFWVKYFSAYDDKEAVSDDVKKEAHKIIVAVFKNPELMRTDNLLESYVVQSLESDKSFSKTFQLLEIFTCKGFKDYTEFRKEKSNQSFMEDCGLKHDDLVTKIRLLTLTSLAASRQVILYSEVAKLLAMDESEVEFIVVEAITSEILDARLDQLNRRIVVRQAESRAFDKEAWQRLDTKLQKWKDNMTNLLKVVQAAKGVNGGLST